MIRLLAAEDNIPVVEWETILDRYNEPGMSYLHSLFARILTKRIDLQNINQVLASWNDFYTRQHCILRLGASNITT